MHECFKTLEHGNSKNEDKKQSKKVRRVGVNIWRGTVDMKKKSPES